MNRERLEEVFPNLNRDEYAFTSDEDENYNCIAWALNDTHHYWWHTPRYGCYWPPGVPRENSLPVIRQIFEIFGYRACEDRAYEVGFEKVAIFEHPEFGVEHVARQLQGGAWTSKIGEWENIQHRTLAAVECEDYGSPVLIMKRRRAQWQSGAHNGSLERVEKN